MRNDIPEEIKVDGMVFELLEVLKYGEEEISGEELVKRAEDLDAKLGTEDGQYVCQHQKNIPENFKKDVVFVFGKESDITTIFYFNGMWAFWFDLTKVSFGKNIRLARLKKD